MKYIGGVSVGVWIIVAIVMTGVWAKSYQAGYEKCSSESAAASDGDVQKLIADLAAGKI